jgi:hypothetical protein
MKQITVIGSGDNIPSRVYEMAEELGRAIASGGLSSSLAAEVASWRPSARGQRIARVLQLGSS